MPCSDCRSFGVRLAEGDETFSIQLSNAETSSDLPIVSGSDRVETTIIDDGPLPVAVAGVETMAGRIGIDVAGIVHAEMLNLYDGVGHEHGAADVSFTDENGVKVSGSLEWDEQAGRLWFVKTGGPFAPGEYTLRLRGGEGGVLHELAAQGLPAEDFVRRVVVEPWHGRTLSIPDVVAALEDFIHAHESSGLPIRISDVAGAYDISFQLDYNPALINIFDVQQTPFLPEDWQLSIDFFTPGTFAVQAQGNTPLPPGELELLTISAAVPALAEVGSSGTLRCV